MKPLQFISKILVGPDDGESLMPIEVNGDLLGFISKSQLFHPVVDGMPVILPRRLRKANLESIAVDAARVATDTGVDGWGGIIDETLRVISAARPDSEWEWQDEDFWAKEYSNLLNQSSGKNWNDRLWRNEGVVLEAVSRADGFRGQVVLDIGAGDGHYFREILAGPRIGDALYVATDISIAALRLNRQLNSHRRAAYIVCSADDLPFRCQSVDAAFLFGILHHSRGQSASLNGVVDLVKDNGLLLLHEGVFRQTFSEFVPALSNRNNESAHEHRLDRKELAEALRSSELEILSYEEYSTVVFGASMKILGRLVVKWRPLFSLISFLDRLLARTLGRVMKLFAGGEVLALLRVNRAGD